MHHKLEELLDQYLKASDLEKEPGSFLFPAFRFVSISPIAKPKDRRNQPVIPRHCARRRRWPRNDDPGNRDPRRRSASTADQAAIQWMLTGSKSVSFAVAQAEEIWVATRVVQEADPHWDTNMTVVGSPERIRYLFPNGIPFGWRTAQGQTGATISEVVGASRVTLPTGAGSTDLCFAKADLLVKGGLSFSHDERKRKKRSYSAPLLIRTSNSGDKQSLPYADSMSASIGPC